MRLFFHDEDIIVVDKPGGLLSVPGRGPDKQDCVVNRLRRIFADLIAQPAVHRLDMHTSGVMVFARTTSAHRHLSQQFEAKTIKKEYIALLDGIGLAEQGWLELKFRLDVENRPYQIHDPQSGKLGITHWRKIREENGYTRVLFKPLTGRTHQLRLHAAHHLGLNCPIVGDFLYGKGNDGDQMMLHASSLTFVHPVSGKLLTFSSAAPF